MKPLLRLRARWRLLFGFCPGCNSSAPAIDTCRVCQNYRGPFPPNKELKKVWYAYFLYVFHA